MKRLRLVPVLAMLVSASLADTLSVRLTDVAYISGLLRGQTRGRALLSIPLPPAVQEARIDFAKLQFPSILIPDTNYLFTIEAYPVTTAWQRSSVTWTYPWRRPGGDYDSLRLARFATATTDSHPIVLDITRAVKHWQTGGDNFGLILKRPDYEGGGFTIEGGMLRQALNSARVKFYFTRIQR
ncbi:MAG: DNRLRE domain-containing protein [candidate division WOR-3 bacterium]